MTARTFLGGLFVVNMVLAAAAGIACLLLSGPVMAVAAGVAGLVGALDLLLLGLLVLKLLTPGSRRLVVVVLLLAKLVLLAGAVVLATAGLDMNPVGIAAGFSSTVVAVLVGSAFVGLSGRDVTI